MSRAEIHELFQRPDFREQVAAIVGEIDADVVLREEVARRLAEAHPRERAPVTLPEHWEQ